MKEETAVTWLKKLLENKPYLYTRDFEKALEMEKEQMMRAFYNGLLCDEGFGSDYAEAYYEENYEVEGAEDE
jgi:hypothetical protein